MTRAQILTLLGGVFLLALGVVRSREGPPLHTRELLLDGGPACPAAPVEMIESATTAAPTPSLIVFHGLGANRLIMLPLGRQFASAGFRVFLVDSPGHGVNPAPFSFAANDACARGLVGRLERSGEIAPSKTVLLGHSLGGAVAIRLADDFVAAGTIAIAAAPLVRPHRLPVNLLLVAPQFDMPPIQAQEREFSAAAGPARDAPGDFRQSRAFRLLWVPRQSHTSPIFSAPATAAMVRWALDSVGEFEKPVPPMDFRAFHGSLLGLAGVLLMFPAALGLCARLAGRGRLPIPGDSAGARPAIALLAWPAAGIFAAAVLSFWMPLARLHILGADYLGSFLLVAGIPLALGISRGTAGSPLRAGVSVAALLVGLALALATIIAVGAWCKWQLAELWLIPARWARLPLLAAALLPASFAEECALGAVAPFFSRRNEVRLLLFFALRGIFWAAMLAAFWTGAGAALLPVIFAGPLAGVSLGARIGADMVRTRIGSPAAAALFGAILNSWFVAAAFPLA